MNSANRPSLQQIAESFAYQRLGAVEQVVRVLREWIVSGAAPGGQVIKQDQVARILAVSKIPVREALRQLEAEGLVRFVQNRGALAADLNLAEMQEIFEIRKQLETLALNKAIPLLSETDFSRAESIIAKTDQATAPAELSELNRKFHHVLYEPAYGHHLRTLINNMHTLADRYVRIHLYLTHSTPRSQSEHKALLNACRERDKHKAIQLLKTHLDNAIKHLSDYFNQHGFEAH